MKVNDKSLSLGILGGCCLGQRHVEEVVAKQNLVAGLGQNLSNFFSVFDLPHIEISYVNGNIQGLFLEALPTSSIDRAEASALMMVLFLTYLACST